MLMAVMQSSLSALTKMKGSLQNASSTKKNAFATRDLGGGGGGDENDRQHNAGPERGRSSRAIVQERERIAKQWPSWQ